MTNRLAHEKSPYLLQHKSNPVDWFPWGAEAFSRAKRENKPIFLSIGYSTCHWCHVMERESFESEEIASLLNEDFISIKVDREERPDIDQIYMTAVQALTRSGGWPLSVFLTPDGKPFTGATYIPPEDRWGRPGMKTLLPRLAGLWKERGEELIDSGEKLAKALQQQSVAEPGSILPEKILRAAYENFLGTFDSTEGGFGGAPKFPRSHDLSFLLRYWHRYHEPKALEMVELTLTKMARGGIYDHLGGGFARYATDEKWLIPHFEKMLYDEAILAKTYVEAFQATKNPFYGEVANDIFSYVLRDLKHDRGGFYSAEDADSEGEEGKFYAWRPEEIQKLLGDDAALFNEFYGVSEAGNFEHGTSVIHVKESVEDFALRKGVNAEDLNRRFASARRKLFEAREKRIRPHLDDKVLTSWNALMISALALGGKVLDNQMWLGEAKSAAEFILKNMVYEGRLLRRYRDGEAAILGFHDDYAYFTLSLIDLYEATGAVRWLKEAVKWAREMERLFWDDKRGAFYFTGTDGEALITRPKEFYDGAVPSGNSIASLALYRLSRMTGDRSFEAKSEAVLKANAEALSKYAVGFSQMLLTADLMLGPTREVVVAGNEQSKAFQRVAQTLNKLFWPRATVLYLTLDSAAEGLKEMTTHLGALRIPDEGIAVYLCEGNQCRPAMTELSEIEKALNDEHSV